MTIRIVVCIDVETDSIEEAYRSISKELNDVVDYTKGRIEWESTDEWYGSYGDSIEVDAINAVRLKVLRDFDEDDDEAAVDATDAVNPVATANPTPAAKAVPMDKVCPCPHCTGPNSYTWFVQIHPFNEQLEIRRCCHCGKDSMLPINYWPENVR